MRMPSDGIKVFDYVDYRDFLRDFYRERKLRNPRFSYRLIAQKVGFRSASFFSQILKGRTNISLSTAARFSQYLGLKRGEADFFETLVQYNQARNPGEKNRYFEKLMASVGAKVRILAEDQYEFYEKWYYTAIRELLYFCPMREDYEALADRLCPPIKPAEAMQAVGLLLRLGLIRRDPQGRLVRADSVSNSTGYEARAESIHRFQEQTLALAKESVRRFPREDRSISTLTLSLSPKGFRTIEEELNGFRRKVLKIAEMDEGEDTVYQINFQVFPLTRSSAGRRPSR